jgi:signal transduction histidine kinase
MNERADHERAIARRVATTLVASFFGLWALRIVLGISTGSLTDQPGWVSDLMFGVGILAFSGLFLLVGWAIVTRQPRNTIGWLLLAIPIFIIGAFVIGDYATEALVTHPGSLPFGRAAAWFDRWLLAAGLAIFIPVFLFFPDGNLPSRRWRPVVWLYATATVLMIVSFAVTPGRMTGALADLTKIQVTNPLGIDGLAGTINGITQIAGFATLASAFLAGAAIVVRYRGATPEVRQQIRWLAFVGVAFLIEFVVGVSLTVALGDETNASNTVGDVMFMLWFVTLLGGIPIACGIAILRYHLYDLDVVVRKTLIFGILAVFITAVYAAVVGAASALNRSTVGSFAAAATLAVLFAPARDRARKLADRLVYGKRATPYEVLADFSGRVGEAYAAEDVLERMAAVLADGTGADAATVWLKLAGRNQPAATSPAGRGAASGTMIPVIHQGEELGALSVAMPAADPMDPTKQKLIEDLAAQAGLVLRNVRLIEELRASRQRLVAAQDEERRKLERNLHDGAQQQLVALAVQLKLAEQLAGTNTNQERELLARLGAQASAALEDLRDLARGIYPPLLADKGLAAALETQARRAAVPTTVEADGVGRYAQEIESAVYFCTLEALNNVAKYAEASQATVRLSQQDGHLAFAVTDDGRGFDAAASSYGTGLQGMADRLDAVGGELRVESRPGTGSTVSGHVPVGGAG